MNKDTEFLTENNTHYQRFSYIINRSQIKRPHSHLKIDVTDDSELPPPVKRSCHRHRDLEETDECGNLKDFVVYDETPDEMCDIDKMH